jgi:hypothetical protein
VIPLGGRNAAAAGMAASVVACALGPNESTEPPGLTAVAAHENPFNVLSAVVTFQAQRADSARLVCRGDGDSALATPYSPTGTGSSQVVALGLLPSTAYDCVVAAIGPGGTDTSASIPWQTGGLPAAIAGARLNVTGTPPPGYIVTEVTGDSSAFTLAFDSLGRVRWYRGFAIQPGEMAIETTQHLNGDFTVYVGASTGWQPVQGRFIEFRPDGEIVQTYAASAPYYTDSHELLLSFAEGMTDAHLFGYDLRTADLTTLGGRPDQAVAGHTLLRQAPSGAIEFSWSAWDHFSIADWLFVPPNLADYPSIDFDHPNSLAIDSQGNYIASFASLGEITKIDGVNGKMSWRFGGRHNQFTILNDPLGGFGFQHDVHVLDNGDLLFYDNGLLHSPPESRAVEYRLDTLALTATLVWQFRHDPPVFTPFVGSVERFTSGSTLVGFGPADLMTEVTPRGAVLWEATLTVDGQSIPYFYRVRRIASLYRYERP